MLRLFVWLLIGANVWINIVQLGMLALDAIRDWNPRQHAPRETLLAIASGVYLLTLPVLAAATGAGVNAMWNLPGAVAPGG